MANPVAAPRFRADSLAIALIVVLVFGFLAGVGALIWREYQSTTDETRLRASSASQVVAANLGWAIETARQVLRRVDESLGPDLATPPGGAEARLEEAISDLPGGPRLYVVAASGTTLLTTDPQFQAINITDRDYFSAVAKGEEWYVSSLLVSRLNGEQIFVMSKRIERNGQFVGAAIISFNSTLMARVWQSLNFDSQSTVSLFRDDGMLVSRYPEPEGPLDLSGYVLFTDLLPKAPEGIYGAISPADGVSRVVAYRRLQGTNLVTLASISTEAAFGALNRQVMVSLLLVVPVALALLLVALWIARLLRRDAKRQSDLTVALEANQMLFREIHHRVKNNLQSVSSLVQLQPLPAEAKLVMSRRIAAMVAVHEHMYRRDQYAAVDASAYVPTIVSDLVEAYGREVAVSYDLAPIMLDRDHATPLGLIVNEVVSNALKYAFPDGQPAELLVTLQQGGDDIGTLTIKDNGAGFDPAAITKGMGSRLIAGLTAQMSGTWAYSFDHGTVFTVTFPLPKAGPVAFLA